MSHKNAAEAKDRPISEKQRSTDTLPQFIESSANTAIPTQLQSHIFQKLVDTDIANDLYLYVSLYIPLLTTFPWYADL